MAIRTVILTQGTSWVVPGSWINTNNRVTCWGGGGGGSDFTGTFWIGCGGGGGASASATNIVLTLGASIAYAIGGGGAGAGASAGNGGAGGDTSFNSGTVLAKGGGGGTTSGGGAGGASASSTGASFKFSGGAGATFSDATGTFQGGGGGAGGTTAAGSAGSTAGTGGAGGATGGGTGGVSATDSSGGPGAIGYNNGSSAAGLGTNFAGGGGGGAYVGYTGPYSAVHKYGGATGGSFGGGGGGGGGLGGGPGSAGAIKIEWNPTGVSPAAGTSTLLTADGYNWSVGMLINQSGSLDMNNALIRSAAGAGSGSVLISGLLGGKYPLMTVVGSSTNNGSTNPGVGSTYQPITSFPGSWQAGDLAIMVCNGYTGAQLNAKPGWVFGQQFTTSFGGAINLFWKKLQTGDTPPTITVSDSYAFFILLVLRNVNAVVGLTQNAITAATGTSASYTVPTHATDCRALLGFGWNTGAYITPNGPWTSIASQNHYTGSAVGYLNVYWTDQANYPAGSTYTWNFGATAYTHTTALVQLN